MPAEFKRFGVFLCVLDPNMGAEMHKTRPCVIVSPDEMNRHSRTVLIAPLTTGGFAYPSRIVCEFAGKTGHVVLDQMRNVDKTRLVKHLGELQPVTQQAILTALHQFFAP